MLINRTIDKPEEKLDLFKEYLKENNIVFEVTYDNDRLFKTNNYYIEEDLLAKILEVTKSTLRNWRLTKKIKPIKNFHLFIDDLKWIDKKVHSIPYDFLKGIKNKPRPYFYNINDVFNFLYFQAWSKSSENQKLINKIQNIYY